MASNSVRSILEITYGDEVRDLKVTFDLIDRIRSKVAWEKLAIEMSSAEPCPDLVTMTKFLYYNLEEAGFKPDVDIIYDEMLFSKDNKQGYIALVAQIIMAYQPRGSKKKQVKTKAKKKK